MAETTKPELTKLDPPETSRTYFFPDGETVRLKNVTAFRCSESGTHRLETGDGRLHIVPPRWLHIEIEASGWTL